VPETDSQRQAAWTSKLPQGSYHLEIRAGDSAGKMTDWRSVNFSVE
jgi:hypothetical protein